MNVDEVVLNQLCWLMEDDQKLVQVVIVAIDRDANMIKVRLPNGAFQQVFPDELEKA